MSRKKAKIPEKMAIHLITTRLLLNKNLTLEERDIAIKEATKESGVMRFEIKQLIPSRSHVFYGDIEKTITKEHGFGNFEPYETIDAMWISGLTEKDTSKILSKINFFRHDIMSVMSGSVDKPYLLEIATEDLGIMNKNELKEQIAYTKWIMRNPAHYTVTRGRSTEEMEMEQKQSKEQSKEQQKRLKEQQKREEETQRQVRKIFLGQSPSAYTITGASLIGEQAKKEYKEKHGKEPEKQIWEVAPEQAGDIEKTRQTIKK